MVKVADLFAGARGFSARIHRPHNSKDAWTMVGNSVETIQPFDIINAIKEAA